MKGAAQFGEFNEPWQAVICSRLDLATTERLIRELRRAGVGQAALFVNPGNLAQPDGAGGEGRIAAYVRAGHVIANHSFSHRALTDMSAEDYLADIDRAEAWLRSRAGYRPWFRFPFLNEGRGDAAKRDAVFAGLAARGLRHGFVTVDASGLEHGGHDNVATRAGLAIDRDALRDMYVRNHVAAADVYWRLLEQTPQRGSAHVMLLHETDIAALWIGDLVAALRADGWQVVTADDAFAGPLGTLVPRVPSGQGPLSELIAWEAGIPAPRWYDGNRDSTMRASFEASVLRGARLPS
ncbi:MAG: polysaccharide deacetylase family protein [Akkermansiaceae bacterium]|nr:polysaccharide deacetylase family protein [Akkermansiaceae bacterium]